jgi:hypothetical protein
VPVQNWAALGGDFAATVSTAARAPAAATGTITWPSTAQFVSDVQFFLDNPMSNHGWMLRARELNGSFEVNTFTARELHSGENALNPPRLSITFTPPPSRLAGDVDNDKDVDRIDLSLLTKKFSATNITGGFDVGDFDNDRNVNLDDLLLLKKNFGRTAPSPEAVPEPATVVYGMLLLALAAVVQIRRTWGA